jgi:ankyrin repeat protein
MAGIGAAPRTLSQQLLKAAKAGRTFECTHLIERKADVNYKEDNGFKYTALLYAARAGKRHTCTALLNAKADLGAREGWSSYTALQLAVSDGSCDMVAHLLEARAMLHEHERYGTALGLAASFSRHDMCLLLLDAKATMTAGAFGIAARLGDVDTCRAFIEAKADVSASRSGGCSGCYTPLMDAAMENRAAVCALLLAAHANPHAQRTLDGRTALHVAASCGARDACVLLLQTDAAPLLSLLDVKDDNGKTALQLAKGWRRRPTTTEQLLRDWRGCAAFDAQTRANWLAPAALPKKGQAYTWAQSRLFDVRLIKEITSFLL